MFVFLPLTGRSSLGSRVWRRGGGLARMMIRLSRRAERGRKESHQNTCRHARAMKRTAIWQASLPIPRLHRPVLPNINLPRFPPPPLPRTLRTFAFSRSRSLRASGGPHSQEAPRNARWLRSQATPARLKADAASYTCILHAPSAIGKRNERSQKPRMRETAVTNAHVLLRQKKHHSTHHRQRATENLHE